MPVTSARAASASDDQEKSPQVRAWRPFPIEVADVLCVEEAGTDVAPRIHERLSIVLVRSAAVVRCESSRSLVTDSNCVLVVPALQLYSLRPQGRATGGTVTLLVGASHVKGLGLKDRAVLVTDDTLVAQVEALVAQLSRPVHSVECATTIRAVLERLTSPDSAHPTAGLHAGRVVRLRDQLRDNPSEPVTTADLAGLSGLTESHVIRSFHREFGLPPHAYHLRRRLAAACELLLVALSVSTVAYECGFADQSHLSRKFKEVYGLTPAAWKNAVATVSPRKAPTKVTSIGPPPDAMRTSLAP